MGYLFQVLYLIVMACIVVAGSYAMCRSQQVGLDRILREALVWGACLVLSATVDYLVIVPAGGYFIAAG